MTFWLAVFGAYLVLIVVGLRLGLWLSTKFPPKPDGGRGPTPTPDDDPGGISAIPDYVPDEWVRDYDRRLA